MSGRCYGKLSRLTENNNPRQYPATPPSSSSTTSPEAEQRYCWFGKHFVGEPERFKNDRGCELHPNPRWREKGI